MLKSKRLGKFVSPFVLTAMLLPAIAGIARAQPKEQEKKKIEVGIRPSVTFPFSNFTKGYYDPLNKDFRTGEYTFRTPIADASGKNLWKDIKTPSSIDFGVEGSCLARLKLGKIKNFRAGVVVGYKGSSPSTSYDKSYNVWDDYSKVYVPLNFKRQEDISTSTISLGARKKASLTDKLDVSSTVGVNFYNVKGDVDYTMDRLDNPYVQYRKADYSGKGTGPFVEAGIEYKLSDNISIGGGFGYRGGKVKAKGKEITSWPDTSYTKVEDYNPKFNFNSAYGKVGVEVKF